MDDLQLASAPGYLFALSYSLMAVVFSLVNPPKHKIQIRLLNFIVFPVISLITMVLTDVGSDILYLPLLLLAVFYAALIIYISCDMELKNVVYFTFCSFLYGEFMTALAWQFRLFFRDRVNEITDYTLMIICYTAIAGLVMSVAYLYMSKRRSDNAKLCLNGKDMLSIMFVAVGVFLFSNLSNVLKNTPFSGQTAFQINLIRTLVDAGGILLLETNRRIREEIAIKSELEVTRKIMDMQYANFQVSEQGIALIHQKYHDLKHQIAYLREEASSEEKKQYLDNMEEELKSFEAGSHTGNHVFDTILTAKILQCQHMGIRITTSGQGRLLNFIPPIDLSALLGNLLDNAIEHVDTIPDSEKRWIQFVVRKNKNFIILEVGNHCEEALSFDGGLPMTTKKDTRFHGYGTKSIRDTVESYGGNVTFMQKDGWFEVKIVFMNNI